MLIRSAQPRTCGETVAPVRTPSRTSSASIRLVVVVFPFVPTMWIERKARSGWSSSASSSCIRSSPKRSGQGLSELSQAVRSGRSDSAGEGIELTPVTGELLALALDHLGTRALDEVGIREHLLGAGDLGLQTRRLGLDAHGLDLQALGLDDGFEDTLLVVGEADAQSAAAVDRCGVLHPLERVLVGGVSGRSAPARARRSGGSGARAGSTRSPRSRAA